MKHNQEKIGVELGNSHKIFSWVGVKIWKLKFIVWVSYLDIVYEFDLFQFNLAQSRKGMMIEGYSHNGFRGSWSGDWKWEIHCVSFQSFGWFPFSNSNQRNQDRWKLAHEISNERIRGFALWRFIVWVLGRVGINLALFCPIQHSQEGRHGNSHKVFWMSWFRELGLVKLIVRVCWLAGTLLEIHRQTQSFSNDMDSRDEHNETHTRDFP